MSQKISDFNIVTSLPDGSRLDLITPGANKTISKNDLITAMPGPGLSMAFNPVTAIVYLGFVLTMV